MPEQRSSVSICLLELGWHLRMSSSDKSATGAGACHAIGHAGCLSRCFKCSFRNAIRPASRQIFKKRGPVTGGALGTVRLQTDHTQGGMRVSELAERARRLMKIQNGKFELSRV